MQKQKVCLFVIDGQNDFVGRSKGSLVVNGAVGDMDRLASMINKHGAELDDIQLTMDSHYHMHIAHSSWWLDKNGNHPIPFTIITEDAMKTGEFRAYHKNLQKWSEHYVSTLAKNNRYPLCIWPDHCIIGSMGQALDPVLFDAVTGWETRFYATAPRTTKGSNMYVEHYSVVKADVEHPSDPMTRLNTSMIDTLKIYDIILTGGEALSHCVANSARDIIAEFSPDQIKKFVLLEDATSSVTGFEKMGEDFINEMTAKGMQLSRTDKFFR